MDFNMITCTTKGCKGTAKHAGLCETCIVAGALPEGFVRVPAVSSKVHEYTLPVDGMGFIATQNYKQTKKEGQSSLADKYPKYHKRIPEGLSSLDVYALNLMFPIDTKDDASDCVLHARKKLLIPGTRSGGKSFWHDVKEARDTLNRYLELYPEPKVAE